MELFEVFSVDLICLFFENICKCWLVVEEYNNGYWVIVDYILGMIDEFVVCLYFNMFVLKWGGILDMLFL